MDVFFENQRASSSVPSDSIGDIIYRQDLPLTSQHFSDIEAFFCHVKTEERIEIGDSPVRKNEQTCLQDSTLVNVQVLQTEQSPPLNSAEQLMNIQDSNVKIVRRNNKKSPASVMAWRILKRITVYVLPYSGESKPVTKIPVDMSSWGNVKELRNELVKFEKKGQLKLPQQGYFFVHEHIPMNEDHSFMCNNVFPGDTIEIFPGKLL